MTEQPTTTLYTALLAAQRAMGPVKKDASNPAFRTKYATLQSVLETIEQPLWDNGLLVVQRFVPEAGGTALITEIIHAESGERIGSAVQLVSKDPLDPQKVGGAITYYRRYSLLALLGLAPEDDDGNSAAKPAQRPAASGVTVGNPVAVENVPAPAAPAAHGPHPLLATIRDDTSDPKRRKTALHNFLMGATTALDLARMAEQVKGCGMPEADLTAAYNWHADRIVKAQPASYAE